MLKLLILYRFNMTVEEPEIEESVGLQSDNPITKLNRQTFGAGHILSIIRTEVINGSRW